MAEKKGLIDKVIDLIDVLPPMPDNIIQIRQAAADPNVNFTMLVPIIKRDSALCADVLHIANSAFYGVGHRVDTVDEAVRYIGIEHLLEFLAVSFSEKVIREQYGNLKELHDYLVHSQQISVAAELLTKAARRSRHDQNAAAIAGLLHDIGRLIMMTVCEQTRRFTNDETPDRMEALIALERDVVGMDHCEVGMRICRKWLYPEHLCEAVHRHHTPLVDEINVEAACILLAHFLVMYDLPDTFVVSVFKPDVLQFLGLTEASVLSTREECKVVLIERGLQ